MEKKSDKLNKNCLKHARQKCETCDDQFTFNKMEHFADNECLIHGSSYPCKVCRAIQNSVCSRSETNLPTRQRAYACRTGNIPPGSRDHKIEYADLYNDDYEIFVYSSNVDQEAHICQTCKEVCHRNHEVVVYGIYPFICHNEMKCSLFYCKKHPKLQVKCIACSFKGAVTTKKVTFLLVLL